MMKKIYFKSNLKHLIKIYKDTQENLAFSLGYNSISTISNWFNKDDDYIPSNSIIENICSRYSINKDLLLYEDLTPIKTPFLFDLPDEILIEFSSFLLPLVEPKDDDSEFFKKGYMKQRELLSKTKVGAEISQLFCEYMDLYANACEKDDSYSALANTLSSLVLIRFNILNKNKINGILKYKSNKISKKNLAMNYFLDANNIDYDDDSFDQTDVEEMDKAIMEIISELKKQPDFQQIADFYLAIRYKLNIANNDLSIVTSEVIFENLLLDLIHLENIYAINFSVYFDKLAEKYLKTSQPVKVK